MHSPDQLTNSPPYKVGEKKHIHRNHAVIVELYIYLYIYTPINVELCICYFSSGFCEKQGVHGVTNKRIRIYGRQQHGVLTNVMCVSDPVLFNSYFHCTTESSKTPHRPQVIGRELFEQEALFVMIYFVQQPHVCHRCRNTGIL